MVGAMLSFLQAGLKSTQTFPEQLGTPSLLIYSVLCSHGTWASVVARTAIGVGGR